MFSKREKRTKNKTKPVSVLLLSSRVLELSEDDLQPVGLDVKTPEKKPLLTFPEKTRLKYNAPACTALSMTEDGAKRLQKKYHEINGLPGFLHRFLHGRPSVTRALFMTAPEMFKFFVYPDNQSKTLLKPNPEYIDIAKFLSDCKKSKNYALKNLKNSPNGLALITWFVHDETLPKEFRGDSASSILMKLKQRLAKDAESYAKNEQFYFYRYGESMKPLQKFGSFTQLPRTDSQKSINFMETQSETPYLASIFDLDIDKSKSLNYLKSLRRDILWELETVYGVTSSDKVKIYFHMPYLDRTTTLHVHIRVNQADHELETAKSFGLNEIIQQLENGLSVKEMILGREVIYCSDYPFGEGVEGVVVKTVPNPFRDFEDMFNLLKVEQRVICYLKKMVSDKAIASRMRLLDFEEISKLADQLSRIPNNPDVFDFKEMLNELKINEKLESCGYNQLIETSTESEKFSFQ